MQIRYCKILQTGFHAFIFNDLMQSAPEEIEAGRPWPEVHMAQHPQPAAGRRLSRARKQREGQWPCKEVAVQSQAAHVPEKHCTGISVDLIRICSGMLLSTGSPLGL